MPEMGKSLPSVEVADPCTLGQVFHKWYRENQAKTMAKVRFPVNLYFSVKYTTLKRT